MSEMARFEKAYSEVSRIITGRVIVPDPTITPDYLVTIVNVMERFAHTLQRLLLEFPGLKEFPLERLASYQDNEDLNKLRDILPPDFFTEINWIYNAQKNPYHFQIIWDRLERSIRRLLSDKKFPIPKASDDPGILNIGSLNISERCLKGCDYCASDSKPTGQQMPWDLIVDILESGQTAFMERISLTDAEPLIYEDKEAGKNLSDVIHTLIHDAGVPVHFTTAGLMPQNQMGREALESLAALGPYISDLKIDVSFNILDKKIPLDVYIGCIQETFEVIASLAPVRHSTLILCRDINDRITVELFRALSSYGIITGFYDNPRCVGPIGRAIDNYDFDEKTLSIISHHCSRSRTPYTSLRVRPNGDVAVHCRGFGFRGTTMGNVYRNDAEQINSLYTQFVVEHEARLKRLDRNLLPCESHRRWNKKFKSPRSKNPVVRRKIRQK